MPPISSPATAAAFPFPLSATVFAVAVLSAGAASAQSDAVYDATQIEAPATRPAPEGRTALPTVNVRDDLLGTTTQHTGSYTTGASTIGKAVQTLKETPQSVTVITRQLLDDQNIRSLDDALRATPGVLVQNSSSYERTYFSRGFEVDTVQYDGVPTVRGSGFAISPDLAAYDRVEVLRGPAGLFTGAGQPGGTVNLVRKRPLAYRQSSAQVTAGRWDAYRGDVDLNLPFNDSGTVRGRLVAAHEDRKFFYDRASTKRSLVYGIVEADLGPRTTLGLGFNYEKNDMVPMYASLPRYTNGADIGLPRNTNLNAAWARTNVESTTVFADLNHRFDNDWRLKASVSHMREDNADKSGSNFGAVNPATGTGPTISAFSQSLLGEQTALDANLQGSFEAFGRKHDVLVGANYQKRDYDLATQLFTVPNSGIDVFRFNPAAFATFPTVPARAATNTLARREQTGIYGSLRFALTEPLKLVVGGRVSSVGQSTLNKITGAYSVRPFKENSEFTPFAALSYDLGSAWTAYASYAEIFRSQGNFFSTTGTPLNPATGENYELGLKGSHLGGKLNSSVALFRTNETGRALTIVPSPCAGSPTGGACSVNDGKVRSQGLDAEISGELLPRWQLAGGYTFNQTRYLRDVAANQDQPLASFTPRHLFKVWSSYQLAGDLSPWTVGGGVTVHSMAFRTSGTARIEQAGYAVWAARVTYRINRNLTAALNVNNVFDKTYYQTLGTTASGNWYGEPRNVTATLQAVF